MGDKEKIEEIEEGEEEDKVEEEPEKTNPKKEDVDIREIIREELDTRIPKKPDKTRAKKIPETDEEEETAIRDMPTCPRCHNVVKETADGWVCFTCQKYYVR